MVPTLNGEGMSTIGLRVGPFEIVGRTTVPEPGDWHLAHRTGMTRRQPGDALVRLLPPDAPPAAREALHRQFEVLKALEDPRVPEAVAFYEGLGALALNAVDGVPLSDVVASRRDDLVPMSPPTLLDLVLEVAETLQRVHHRNRFHGDLSPDRVLLAPDGRLWIFGFGQPYGATPRACWMAPEVARGEQPGPGTDQWFLGVLLVGLVCGRVPWPDEPVEAAIQAGRGHVEAMIEPVDRQWPALGRLVRRLTESRPENRFPSMHPVRQELLALARKAGGTSARRELGADLARPRGLLVDPDDAAPARPAQVVFDDDEADELAQTPISAPRVDPPSLPPDGFATPRPAIPRVDPPSLPVEPTGPDLTISEEVAVASPSPARRRPLPDEPFPIVRPDPHTDVPIANVGVERRSTPASTPAATTAPAAVAARAAAPAVAAAAAVVAAPAAPLFVAPRPAISLPAPPEVPVPASPQPADVVIDPSDPQIDEPVPDPSLIDLADEFASEVDDGPGASDTILPLLDIDGPSDPSEPGAPMSFPPLTISPRMASPSPASPGEMSLGLGRASTPTGDEPDFGLPADEEAATEHDDIGPAPIEPAGPSVATDDLVRKVAPVVVGVFILTFVVWMVSLAF
jgi:serine/threonine protein kinase